MKTRKVKLYRKHRRLGYGRYTNVPELRLSGNWLKAAGFEIGHQLKVEVSNQQLIIKLRSDDDS